MKCDIIKYPEINISEIGGESMKNNRIIAFAKQHGYDNAIYLGKWKGYDAYEPVFDGADVSFVGLPFIILAKGDTVRMSTSEEALEQIQDTAKK
jgi:hypothetical protein